jgi:hypothetical protein
VGEPTHCPELFITVLPETATTPDVIKLPPVMLPVTASAVNVPVEVMLGCAAVVTVPAVVAAPETVIV